MGLAKVYFDYQHALPIEMLVGISQLKKKIYDYSLGPNLPLLSYNIATV